MKKTRVVEKRDWRKNLEKCWNVQENLSRCIKQSDNFKGLDHDARDTVLEATGKNFIWNYLNMWARKDYDVPSRYDNFFRTDSDFWNKNEKNLIALNSECNLFSLYECSKETYDLNNLKGNYEYLNRDLSVTK
jgi:hypothetical protein